MTAQKSYAEEQPKDGSHVVHCGHLGGPTHHYWKCPGSVFTRPDGSCFQPEWLICCDQCYQLAGGDPAKVDFRGDALWKGNAPIIIKPDQQ